MFGDLHFSMSPLHVSQRVEDKEDREYQEGLSIIDVPITEGVQPGGGASPPDASAQGSAVFGGAGRRKQAEVSNKGLRGVYGFGFWSLIECLEDKIGDISHPSGQ